MQFDMILYVFKQKRNMFDLEIEFLFLIFLFKFPLSSSIMSFPSMIAFELLCVSCLSWGSWGMRFDMFPVKKKICLIWILNFHFNFSLSLSSCLSWGSWGMQFDMFPVKKEICLIWRLNFHFNLSLSYHMLLILEVRFFHYYI